jgi:hypothetical protein
LADEVMVSQEGSLVEADHAQPAGAVTVTEPPLPPAPTVAPVGAIPNVHTVVNDHVEELADPPPLFATTRQ